MSEARELYPRVQDFYARQTHLLDAGAADEWAATFTDDGVFEQSSSPEPRRGRGVIAEAFRRAAKRRADEDAGAVRRHWFGMLAVSEQPDGTVHTSYYAIVLRTPPGGGAPEVRLSASAEDVLVPHGAGFLVRRRAVFHDGH